MSQIYRAINKRNGNEVRMFEVDNTRLLHYEVWNGNRVFSTPSKAEAYRIYNEQLR